MIQSDMNRIIGELINARLSAGMLAEQSVAEKDYRTAQMFIMMRDVLKGLEDSTINYTRTLKTDEGVGEQNE